MSHPEAPPPPYGQVYPPAYPSAGQPYPPPAQAAYAPPGQAAYPPPGQAAYVPPGQGPPPPQIGFVGFAQGPPPQTQYQQPPPAPVQQRSSYQDGRSMSMLRRGNSAAINPNWAGTSFSDKSIRHAFIRKVYIILSAQLAVTVGCIAFFLFYLPAKHWVRDNVWFYYISYLTFLVLFIALYCCPSVRRNYPTNFICLALFTLAMSYMTAAISSYHKTNIVLICLGMTTVICFSITVFAFQTKVDFTLCSGVIFVFTIVLLLLGVAILVVNMAWGSSYIMNCVWGSLAALLFGIVLVFDTQMLMGGKKYELSPEEHIYGALNIYLDIVQLFLILLCLLGGGGDS